MILEESLLWYNEATLYLNGYTYWCECSWDYSREKPMHFFVYKYRSVVHNEKGEIWTFRLIENGDVVDYSVV